MKRSQALVVIGILVFVAISLVIVVFVKKHESFGVVDTQVLVTRQSALLAAAYPNGDVPSRVLQTLAENIKQVIQEYGKHHHLTLLAKGAVLSSSYPDYTETLQDLLTGKGLS